MNSNNNYNKITLRRNSFSDRFCDNLSEVLLSFVSFEDKIRFECVSHQFQRLLFNKQYVLEVFYSKLKTQNNLYDFLVEKDVNESVFKKINLIAIERVLKKCKFINKIVIDINGIEFDNREKVLQLISKYAKHLKSIEFDFKGINGKVLLQFGTKCGQKLQNIDFCNYRKSIYYDYKAFIKLCPNIRSLTKIRLEDIIEKNDILLPKLLSIKGLDINPNNNLFDTFVKKTQKCLICLGIGYNFRIAETITLKSVSNFVNLQELSLNLSFGYNEINNFNNALLNIGINCKQISKLFVNLYYTFDAIDLENNFDFLKSFTQLKRLHLNYWSKQTLKSLQDCKQLTHLFLDNSWFRAENFFDEIKVYLPQLIWFYSLDQSFDDFQIKSLSKLKSLKYVIIDYDVSGPKTTDEGICQIINNCPEIHSISYGVKPNITHKTIDALISLAEKKPFRDFVHSFGPKPDFENSESEQNFDYLEFLTNKKYPNLPKNLNIIPFNYYYLKEWK